MVSNRRKSINGASSSSPSGLCLAFSCLSISNLIPGLPDDLACVCLACVPLWQHGRLKAVCKGWNLALSGEFIIELRHKLGKSEEFLCLFRDDPSLCPGEVFDPRAAIWSTFPPMPCNPSKYSLSNFECVSVAACLYVLGGSMYDTRSFPMDQPVSCNSVFRFSPVNSQWRQCADMKSPRGSFACGISDGFVFVAGGGSRHALFKAGGDRICEAERYDLQKDCWESLPALSRIRAGCAGFFVGNEFWVLGGYGEPGTISGILPVDEQYNDGEVFDMKTGEWRRLEAMWEEGERRRLGRIAVLYSSSNELLPSVFMLEDSKLFRYDFVCNRWFLESELPVAQPTGEVSCRLICVDGEVYVIPGGVTTDPRAVRSSNTEQQRSRRSSPDQRAGSDAGRSPRGFMNKNDRNVRRGNIIFQIYHPTKRTWRSVVTKPPLEHSSNPPWGAMCVMKL